MTEMEQVFELITISLIITVLVGIFVFILRNSAFFRKKRMQNPCSGELLVTAVSMPSRDSRSANCRITGIISADGMEPTPVKGKGIFRTNKWPMIGQKLPVTVDRANPMLFAIEWDAVQSNEDLVFTRAQKLAEQMRGKPPDGS